MRARPGIEALPQYEEGKRNTKTIKLSSNENPLGPSPLALKAIQGSLAELHYYPDVRSMELCQALAIKYGVSPEQVIIGSGSDEIILFVVKAFLNSLLDSPEEVIVGEYSFSMYSLVTQGLNGIVRRTPMPNGEYDSAAILDGIHDKTRIIFLTSPNNPTGCILSRAMLEELLEKIPRDILIVVDEAYGDFVDGTPEYVSAVEYVDRYDNLLVLRTFSKLYGLAGLRVGYGIAQKEIIDILLRVKPPFNNSTLAQRGALAALNDHDFIERTKRCNAEGKAKLLRTLIELSLPYFPPYPNFISFHVPELADIAVAGIAEGGIMLRSLRSFGLDNWLRATIGKPEHVDLLVQILQQRYGQDHTEVH